ncbi:MAG: hypothetical protein EHM35_03190 [Planctomycetaceae bacterium]|nr:MAG: hypothetical protein EHM35_03190 [Planctomycetaceae bacterium]
MNASIFFLAWLMSLGTPAPGDTGGMAVAAPPAAARIKLDISAREELKNAIRQHLTMELQAQQPVQFVESDPDWTLGVVTTELTDANGATVAVGLSFIVEQHGIHATMLKALAQACRYFLATGLLKDAPLERDMQLLLRGAEVLPEPEGLAVVSQHKMCVITPDRVPQACSDMVAAFSAECLGTAGTPNSSADTKPPAILVENK